MAIRGRENVGMVDFEADEYFEPLAGSPSGNIPCLFG